MSNDTTSTEEKPTETEETTVENQEAKEEDSTNNETEKKVVVAEETQIEDIAIDLEEVKRKRRERFGEETTEAKKGDVNLEIELDDVIKKNKRKNRRQQGQKGQKGKRGKKKPPTIQKGAEKEIVVEFKKTNTKKIEVGACLDDLIAADKKRRVKHRGGGRRKYY